MQLNLTLDSLGQLDDGSAELIINQAITEAVMDLEDRGRDGKERVVEIRIGLTQRENGTMAEINVEANAKLPRRRTASTVGLLKRDGQSTKVLFQGFCPENPNQPTLHDFAPPLSPESDS